MLFIYFLHRTNLTHTVTFGSTDLDEHFVKPGFYQFAMFLCSTSSVQMRNPNKNPTCDARLVMLNPGGEHLSSDEISLPEVYSVLTIVWVAVAFLWALNWVMYYRMSNKLHDLVVVLPAMLVVHYGVYHRGYKELSQTGDTGNSLIDIGDLTETAIVMHSFFILLLLASGYCIINATVKKTDLLTFVSATVGAFAAISLMSFVHRYFLAIAVVTVVVIILTLLKHTSKNVLMLRMRLREIERTQPRQFVGGYPLAAPLLAKRFLIESSRAIFVAYAALWANVGIFDITLQEDRTKKAVLDELLLMFLVVAIMWVTYRRPTFYFIFNSMYIFVLCWRTACYRCVQRGWLCIYNCSSRH
eukprot:m.1026685 g.1026685  ORF g.1026685 m.1026685 type:complete len:357 (+) comp24108_c0_seq39:848-1918(+)